MKECTYKISVPVSMCDQNAICQDKKKYQGTLYTREGYATVCVVVNQL